MKYLSNITKQAGLAEKVAQAAKASGQDVRLESGPMPYTGTFDDEGYNREALLDTDDCIVAYGGEHPTDGYFPFWREFDKLEWEA